MTGIAHQPGRKHAISVVERDFPRFPYARKVPAIGLGKIEVKLLRDVASLMEHGLVNLLAGD